MPVTNPLYLYVDRPRHKTLPTIVPQWTTVPASSTRTNRPRVSTLKILAGLPVPRPASQPKPTFDQLLQSIKNMDGLVLLPSWRNYMSRERALELSRVLRNYGGYNQLHWNLTSGYADPYLDLQIRTMYPDYPRRFSKKDDLSFKGILIPGTNIGLDVPHFNASLSKYLDNDVSRRYIPADWAGWAGDMFTLAYQLDTLHGRHGVSVSDLRDFANFKIGAPKDQADSTFDNTFGQDDFYADIDARNISTLVNNGLSYHDAMDSYYNKGLYSRFGNFVNSYGGWKNFEKCVNRYNFFPMTPTVNPIFIDAVKRAFLRRVREGCLNEMDCYIP